MTKQITNMIDAGVAYERIMRVIGKLRRTINVAITKKLWRQEATTTIITVENQKDAAQVRRLLCEEIGGKEITIKFS